MVQHLILQSRITTPEANITVANVGTLYATTNVVINKEDVSEANITVANVSTLYVTNEAVLPGINVTKMDVPEANITVANVGTAYITTGSVINEANITQQMSHIICIWLQQLMILQLTKE